jgi:hypothetical protein
MGRPLVPYAVKNERNTPIMAQPVILSQRQSEHLCPPWCTDQHDDDEAPGTRSHWADGTTIHPTAPTPTVMTDLNQIDGLPPVLVLHDSDGKQWNFDVDTADQVSRALADLVTSARAGMASPQPGCQPWCAEHIPGESDGDGGCCMGGDLTPPTSGTRAAYVGISYTQADGVRVDFGGSEGNTLDQAEQFAHAILRQVAIGRPQPSSRAMGDVSAQGKGPVTA